MPSTAAPASRRHRRRTDPVPDRPVAAAPARAAMRMVSRFPPPAGPCPLRAAPPPASRPATPDDDPSRDARPAGRRPDGPPAKRRVRADDGRSRHRPASRARRPVHPAPGAAARGALRTPVWLGLLVGGLLAGCATGIGPAPRAALSGDGAGQAETPVATPVSLANELGRQALHERRFDEAATWFAQATDANPDLAETWNGRAVALAALGRLAEAEAAVDAAFARGLDSDDLRANRAWLQRHRPASTASASTADTRAQAAATEAAPPTEPPATVAEPAVAPLLAQPPAEPLAEPVATAPVEPAAAPPRRAVRLEVSNGTGAGGLARRTAQALTARDTVVAATRLTNHPHFGVEQTELQLREDADPRLQRALVREVARTLGVSVAVVRVSTLAPGVDARLVLGQDSLDPPVVAARTPPPVRDATRQASTAAARGA